MLDKKYTAGLHPHPRAEFEIKRKKRKRTPKMEEVSQGGQTHTAEDLQAVVAS